MNKFILDKITNKNIMPKDVNGCVLSLIAKKANKGQPPTILSTATPIWADQSKSRATYAYSNMVSNGDFANGTTGWSPLSVAGLSASLSECAFTPIAQYGSLYIPNMTWIANHKYYCTAQIYGDSNTKIYLSDNTTFTGLISHTATIGYEKVSGIYALPSSVVSGIETCRFGVRTQGTSSWIQIKVKEVMCIDLTALGLDTLTTAQCDELFPFTAKTNTATTPITQIKYNALDWAQWTKSFAGSATVSVDNSSISCTGDGVNTTSATYIFTPKINTKYGAIFNIPFYTTTTSFYCKIDNKVLNGTMNSTGNFKGVITTDGTITNNYFRLGSNIANFTGTIKIKDIRVFELPTGSQIETDFTNLTADQLTVLYPMGVNEATSNPRANDCLMTNQAGTSSSGWLTEVNANSGKTVYYNKLDASDDYGLIINSPSLDITALSQELCLTKTFRIPVGSTSKWMFIKSESSEATTQYGLKYDSVNKCMELWLEGVCRAITKINSIYENVWYNVIFYRNNAGLITSYLNKVKTVHGINYSNLASNGDFEDGLTGWSNNGQVAAIISTTIKNEGSKSLKIAPLNQSAESIQDVTCTDGHIIYCVGYVYVESKSAGNMTYTVTDKSNANNGVSASIDNNNFTSWQKVSIKKTAGNGGIRLRLGGGVSNTYVAYWDAMMCIDLTALGLNTLSTAQCNSLFPFTALTSPSLATSTDSIFTSSLTSRPNTRLNARPTNIAGTTHADYLGYEDGGGNVYSSSSLDISKIIRAERNISKEYTGASY